MKPILLEIIKRIHTRKKANKVVPDYVTLTEIRVEILTMTENELSNLCNKGMLITGPAGTNTEYFKIIKK